MVTYIAARRTALLIPNLLGESSKNPVVYSLQLASCIPTISMELLISKRTLT